MATRVYVEGFLGVYRERVTLNVEYGDTLVRTELPVIDPLFDREPGVDVYRRQIQELMTALEEWEASHEPISWRHPPKT